MSAVCALMLTNLCVPAAYASVSETVGVVATRPADPAEIKRLGIRVQAVTRTVTNSAPVAELKRVCAGRVCVLYRSSCTPAGASCVYEEWPIARAAIRKATLIPLQEIRLQAVSAQVRRTAELVLQIVTQDQRGRTFVPLARLSPNPLLPLREKVAARAGG